MFETNESIHSTRSNTATLSRDGGEGRTRRRVLSVAAACALAMAVVGAGCEKSSDRAAHEAVEAGSAAIRGGNSEGAVTKLSAVTSDMVGGTVVTKSTLGLAQLDLAREKAGAVDLLYVEISRLQTEISNLVTAVSVGNTLVDGYKAQDPNPSRAKIKQRITEAQGGPDKLVWVETGRGSLPTLAAAKQNVSKLKELVAGKQEEISSLEKKRTETVLDADGLAAKIDGLKGRESVDAYTKASEARKAVTVASNLIEVAQGQLTVLNSDLAIAEGQLKVVEKFISELQNQDKALSTGFDAVVAQISAQQTVSKDAVIATGEAAHSVSAKAELLAAKLDEAAKLFDDAEKTYNDAIASYDAAAEEAGKLRGELDARKDQYKGKNPYNEKMIDELKKTLWPAAFRTQSGVATAALGDLYAARAQIAGEQETLVAAAGPVLSKAGAPFPEKLKAETDGAKNARAKALDTYAKAAGALDGAASSIQGDPARERAAHLSHIFVLASWAQQLKLTGDATGADAKLKQASELASSIAQENNGKFPTNLPAGVTITAPAPAPAN